MRLSQEKKENYISFPSKPNSVEKEVIEFNIIHYITAETRKTILKTKLYFKQYYYQTIAKTVLNLVLKLLKYLIHQLESFIN